jgi:hypothetical protein
MAPVVRRWVPVAAALAAVLVIATIGLYLGTRDDETDGSAAPPTTSPTGSVAPLTPDVVLRPDVAALVLIPMDAEFATITDLDAIRERLGVPDLTSADLMTERQAFWDRAGREAVLLTDGLLRDDASELWLDYDLGQDDVDWEARFTGPAGAGYVLAFRPDQDMTKVQRAVDAGVGPLEGATVWPDLHLVVEGVADEGEPVWANDVELTGLVGEPQETTYLRRGCIPMDEALGTDATVEDQDAVLAEHDPTRLESLSAVAVSFGDDVATAWFVPDRGDLFDRAALLEGWPTTGSIGWSDGFTGTPAVDPGTGRIGLHVANPVAAANLTLTEILPFGICNQVNPIAEPTGL